MLWHSIDALSIFGREIVPIRCKTNGPISVRSYPEVMKRRSLSRESIFRILGRMPADRRQQVDMKRQISYNSGV